MIHSLLHIAIYKSICCFIFSVVFLKFIIIKCSLNKFPNIITRFMQKHKYTNVKYKTYLHIFLYTVTFIIKYAIINTKNNRSIILIATL